MDAVGVAVEHHRPVVEVGHEPGREGAVVVDQVALGVTLLRPEGLFEIGERHLGPRSRLGRPLGPRRRCRRGTFAHAVLDPLVGALVEEHGVAQLTRLGGFGIAHLDDDLRLDPDVRAFGYGAGDRGIGAPVGIEAGAQVGELGV